jgi:hypothetical protein
MYFEKSIIYLLLFIIIFNLNLNDIINKKSINNLFSRLLFSNFTKKYITTDKVNYTDKSNNLNKNNNLNKDTIKSVFDNNLNKDKNKNKNKDKYIDTDTDTDAYTDKYIDTDTYTDKYIDTDTDKDKDKDKDKDTDTDTDISTIKSPFHNNLNNCEIVLYKDKDKDKSKYLLNDIYDNFFNNKIYKIDDISIDKNLINIETSNNIILNDTQNNILLNKIDNFIIYNFQTKKNVYYKIKCKLKTNFLKNIKLIISNNKKRFMYNSMEYNCINKIYEYGFILDYNIFDTDDLIYIYLLFYNDENKDFLIDSIFIEVIENTLIQKNNSIIIFNVNNKYNPIYSNTQNILDYTEESSIFFI